jgi:hypothetical protein
MAMSVVRHHQTDEVLHGIFLVLVSREKTLWHCRPEGVSFGEHSRGPCVATTLVDVVGF